MLGNYAHKGEEWFSFQDFGTLKSKLDLIRSKSMNGVFFWAANIEDHSNACECGKYPLIEAAKKLLHGKKPNNPGDEERPCLLL